MPIELADNRRSAAVSETSRRTFAPAAADASRTAALRPIRTRLTNFPSNQIGTVQTKNSGPGMLKGFARGGDWAILTGVEISEQVQCPFCGQSFEALVDTQVPQQTFTIDCEICCRPMRITTEAEPGEILSINIQSD